MAEGGKLVCFCRYRSYSEVRVRVRIPYPYSEIEVSPYQFRFRTLVFDFNPYRFRFRTMFSNLIRTSTVSVLTFWEVIRTRTPTPYPFPYLVNVLCNSYIKSTLQIWIKKKSREIKNFTHNLSFWKPEKNMNYTERVLAQTETNSYPYPYPYPYPYNVAQD